MFTEKLQQKFFIGSLLRRGKLRVVGKEKGTGPGRAVPPRPALRGQQALTTTLRYKRLGVPWEPIFLADQVPNWFLTFFEAANKKNVTSWGVGWWADADQFSLLWLREEGILEPDLARYRRRYDESVHEDFSKTPVRTGARKVIFDVQGGQAFVPRGYFETFYWRRIKPYVYWSQEVVHHACHNYLFLYQSFLGARLRGRYIFPFVYYAQKAYFYDFLYEFWHTWRRDQAWFYSPVRRPEKPKNAIVIFKPRPKALIIYTPIELEVPVRVLKKKLIVQKSANLYLADFFLTIDPRWRSPTAPRKRYQWLVVAGPSRAFFTFRARFFTFYKTKKRRPDPEPLELLLRNFRRHKIKFVVLGFFTLQWRVWLWAVFEMSFINRQNIAPMSLWIDLFYRGLSPMMLFKRLRNYYRRNRLALFGTYETYVLGFAAWCWYLQKHAGLFFNFKWSGRALLKILLLTGYLMSLSGLHGMGAIAIDGAFDPERRSPLRKPDEVSEEFDEPDELSHTYMLEPDDTEWAGEDDLEEFCLDEVWHPEAPELGASETFTSSTWPRDGVEFGTGHLMDDGYPFYRLNLWEKICNFNVGSLAFIEHPLLFLGSAWVAKRFIQVWSVLRRLFQVGHTIWWWGMPLVVFRFRLLFYGFWFYLFKGLRFSWRLGTQVVRSLVRWIKTLFGVFGMCRRALSVAWWGALGPVIVFFALRHPGVYAYCLQWDAFWRHQYLVFVRRFTVSATKRIERGFRRYTEWRYWLGAMGFWSLAVLHYFLLSPGPGVLLKEVWGQTRRVVFWVCSFISQVGAVLGRASGGVVRTVRWLMPAWVRPFRFFSYFSYVARFHPDALNSRSLFWVKTRVYAWSFWGRVAYASFTARFLGWSLQCRLAAIWFGHRHRVQLVRPTPVPGQVNELLSDLYNTQKVATTVGDHWDLYDYDLAARSSNRIRWTIVLRDYNDLTDFDPPEPLPLSEIGYVD